MLKTRSARVLASNFVVAALLDVALAYLIATKFSDGDFWLLFIAAFGALWLLPILFGVKSAVYKALFYLINRGDFRRALQHEFRKAELPLLSGTDFNDPADQYFAAVSQDDTLPEAARLYAAKMLGQLALIPSYSPTDSVLTHVTLDAALADYFDELRRAGVRPHLKAD